MASTSIGYQYASALARCTELLREVQPSRIELRVQLRALKAISRQDQFSLLRDESTLRLNGVEPQAHMLQPLRVLLDRLRVHGARSVEIQRFAPTTELFRLCQLLAADPDQTGGPTLVELASLQRLWCVRLTCATKASTEGAQASIPDEPPAVATIRALHQADDPERIAAAQHELPALVEAAAERGEAPLVHGMIVAAAAAERDTTKPQSRLAWAGVLQKMFTVPVMQMLAQHLPEDPDPTLAIGALRRSGDAGAKALINHLMAASTLEQRRVYFDAIVSIRAGIPILLDAVHHPQWYVVRNAASLLGEMRVSEADTALIALLEHNDDRVRKAAADALVMIGTPPAIAALQRVLRDPVAAVRQHAATAFTLHAEGGARFAAPLTSALDVEEDDDVQIEILSALGRLGTPDAVQRLIKAISPTGAARRPVEFRLAAVEALAAARGKTSLGALRPLLSDSNLVVREYAQRIVARLALL